jgi:hypothetical protein
MIDLVEVNELVLLMNIYNKHLDDFIIEFLQFNLISLNFSFIKEVIIHHNCFWDSCAKVGYLKFKD